MNSQPPACIQLLKLLKDFEELERKKDKIYQDYSDILKKIAHIKQQIKMKMEKCVKP